MPAARREFVMVPAWLHAAVAMRCVGVYAGLRAFDVPGGRCSPTEGDVAQLLGVSASTVKRAVRDLRAAKAVRLEGQRRGSRNIYTFPTRKGQSFSKVPVALLGQVPIGAVGVYSVLRSFDGAKGCYPAIATVAGRARLGHTATQDALRVLRSIGAVEVVARYQPGGAPTSNLYRFPDIVRRTTQLVEKEADAVGGEHKWGQQPGVSGVSSRVPVGSAGGHELENLTRDSDQEMVSRCPPPAVSRMVNEKSEERAKQAVPEVAAQADGGPWYHYPLSDLVTERLVWDLVNTLSQSLIRSGRNKPADTTREAWARTARVMLVHENRDPSKVYEIIENACADLSWSNAINNMYDISRHWDRLVATFSKRRPKRFKPRTDKLVAQTGPPPVDYSDPSTSLGTVSLADLTNWDEESVPSLGGRGLLAVDFPTESDKGDLSATLTSLRSVLARRRQQDIAGPR
jgi:hypothetical protein